MDQNTIHPSTLVWIIGVIVLLFSIAHLITIRKMPIPASPAGSLSISGWSSIVAFACGALLMFLVCSTSPFHGASSTTGKYLGTIKRAAAPTQKVQRTGPGEFHLDPLDTGRWVVYHKGNENGKYVSDTYALSVADNVEAVAFYIEYPNGEYTNPVLLNIQ